MPKLEQPIQIFYHAESDQLGLHLGCKVLQYEGFFVFWPHVLEAGWATHYINTDELLEQWEYVGEL